MTARGRDQQCFITRPTTQHRGCWHTPPVLRTVCRYESLHFEARTHLTQAHRVRSAESSLLRLRAAGCGTRPLFLSPLLAPLHLSRARPCSTAPRFVVSASHAASALAAPMAARGAARKRGRSDGDGDGAPAWEPVVPSYDECVAFLGAAFGSAPGVAAGGSHAALSALVRRGHTLRHRANTHPLTDNVRRSTPAQRVGGGRSAARACAG